MSVIAIAQMRPALSDMPGNVEKTLRMLDRASEQGARLVVFPELGLTGCCLERQEAQAIAEPIPGPSTDRIADRCRSLGVSAVVCTIEVSSDDQYFNTAVLIGSDGIRACYRKTHLPALGVDRFLEPGDALSPVIATDAGRVGILVCWDVFFPEVARSLALAGAQAILAPTAWLSSNDPTIEFYRVRAVENGVYVFWANRVGEERGLEFAGRSGVASPDGKVLARASSAEEEILCLDVELGSAQSGRLSGEYDMNALRERRPELYSRLVESA